MKEIYLFQWNFAHLKILLNRTLDPRVYFYCGKQNCLLTWHFKMRGVKDCFSGGGWGWGRSELAAARHF